jgi:hypothetical protein
MLRLCKYQYIQYLSRLSKTDIAGTDLEKAFFNDFRRYNTIYFEVKIKI